MSSVVPISTHRGLSKSVVVYDWLRSQIIRLERSPGSRIDKVEVCEQLGVSRHPVAEALARLADERLVDVLPQSGTFVSRVRLQDVEEAAFIRRAIEEAAVRDIAATAKADLLTALQNVVSYQSLAADKNDTSEFYQLDLRFHSALLGNLGHQRAAEIVEAVRAPLERARRMLLPDPARNADTLREHCAIVEALASRDRDRAAAAMRVHLNQAMQAFYRFASDRPELFDRR